MRFQAFILTLFSLFATGCGTGTSDDGGAKKSDSALDIVIHDGDFATIQQFTTPGGVSVWLVEEPSIPILSVQMAWKGGSTTDPNGLEGLTGSVVYQLNEGAGDLESLDYQKRMEELNMSFGCSNGRDWTSCSASMLTDFAQDSMEHVALAFESPRFDDGPYERFRRETLVGLKERETSASYLASEAIENAIYPDHVYARDSSEDSINALTRELAKEHMRKLMVRDTMLVTAVGAISPSDLAPLIDQVVLALPETGDLPEFSEVERNDPVDAPIVVDLPQPQSLVRFTAPGLKRENPDFFPAYVLNYTLGAGGFESRLMKTLRVEKGLTYGIGTGLSYSDHLQSWSGGGQTKNESAGEFIEGIKAELQKFVDEGVTAEELADAKAYLTGSYPLAFDSNGKIASNMMGVRQDGLGVDYFDKRNALINSVTLEDVNRVAKEYLSPENFTFVAVGEPEGL